MGRIIDLCGVADTPGGPCRKERVVLACGCFDLFHYGHLRHLQQARSYADVLAVLVTPDRFVGKGPGRPVRPERDRLGLVAALGIVDYAVLNDSDNAVKAIHKIRPDYYVKGKEYVGKPTPALEAEKAAVEAVGGELVFAGEDLVHTSDLLASRNADWLAVQAAKESPWK